jgi:radical SAM superfamily enzyme YgiQ (UPF0313 family)
VNEIREFSENFPKKVGMPFEFMGSPLTINEEKVALLVGAGLWRIRMGIESGSDRTKKEIYNRPMPNKAVSKAVGIINKYNIISYYFLIIGNPYEEREDLMETARFLASLPKPFYIQTFNLVLLPGTHLYKRAVSDGLIKSAVDSGYELDFRAGLHHEGHSWKKKNLYLNGLLFLMEGENTKNRFGFLPAFLLPILLHTKVMDFNERHHLPIKSMIFIKLAALSLRTYAANFIRRVFGDPMIVHDFAGYIRKRFGRNDSTHRAERIEHSA